MKYNQLQSLPLKNIRLHDSFWNNYIGLVENVILPYMWDLINDRVDGAEKSYCIHNFKVAAGLLEGTHQGAVFQDTDVAKWLEAVAYSLAKKANPKLSRYADEAIDLIGKAQCTDGYLDTYNIITGTPRWSDLTEGHELYTAGHMIEAAVAYYEATGKRKFLDIVCRFADCIDLAFGREEGKIHGYPGHPEVELALMRLYKVTGEKRYADLARYFIKERGKEPNYLANEDCRKNHDFIFPEFADFDLDYMQADCPLSEQKEAEGHAVRAVYLYSGMADVAAEYGDDTMFAQCQDLWNSITQTKMYITGSIGSASYGERFTGPYDLPNDTNYSESCASIGLSMFSNRMFHITRDARYMDVVECALYNTVLAGIALDGKHYFYVNPLEVNPATASRNPTMNHVKTVRQKWFGVACCPPNIARTLASLGNYILAWENNTVFVNLYIACDADAKLTSGTLSFTMDANYPNTGKIIVTVKEAPSAESTLALRIPSYSEKYRVKCNGSNVNPILNQGYRYITRLWQAGDRIELDLDVDFRYVYCNPNADENIGKTALMKGPWVYCLEEADNGKHLAASYADTWEQPQETTVCTLPPGIIAATFSGIKGVPPAGACPLYTGKRPVFEKARFTAIPYCLWNNRGEGEMLVWMKDMHAF